MNALLESARRLWLWLEALDTADVHRFREDRVDARLARLEAAVFAGDDPGPDKSVRAPP